MAGERLAPYGDRFTGVHAVYDELPDVLADQGLASVDAVLFDLGVSSMQLDVTDRGFAYREDAPLDMRMDAGTGPTAADVLNTYPDAELTRILREYGEEKFARKIAAAVVREREREPFTTSARLVELLYAEIPAPARRTGGHPAKRTFQALRMEVNDELAVLRRALPAAVDAISVGGRVVVESYHSLEDRLVKQAFSAVTRSEVPPDMPFVPEGMEPALRLVTRGAEQATAAEIQDNPRAASVRLRAVERVRGVAHPSMSSPAVQLRSRMPRIAPYIGGAAVEKARLRVVPAARAQAHPGAVRGAGQPGAARRRDRAAPLQHLDAAVRVRDHRARVAGRHAGRPAADPRDGARRAPQPPAGRRAGAVDGHGPGRHPGVPPAPGRQGARRADPRHRGEQHPARRPGPPVKPEILDPDPIVRQVVGAGPTAQSLGQALVDTGRRPGGRPVIDRTRD